jgi:hypothetical protein
MDEVTTQVNVGKDEQVVRSHWSSPYWQFDTAEAVALFRI